MSSREEIQFVNNCLTCIPITLFLYDWVLTFGDEVEFIWVFLFLTCARGGLSAKLTPPQRRKLSWKIDQPIFLGLRYGTLALMALMGVLFKHVSEAEHRRQTLASIAGTLVIFVLAQVLLQFRVYIIYNRSRTILWTNIGLFAIEAAVTIYLFLHLFSKSNVTCHTMTCNAYPPEFGLVYVAPLLYETYLLGLAAWKSWVQRESLRQLGTGSILDILVRGSVLYFALVASGMAISMIIFFAAPKYVDWLDLLSDATGSIGGTHLILSMREALLRPVLPTQASTTLFISHDSRSVRMPWNSRRRYNASQSLKGTKRESEHFSDGKDILVIV